MSKNITRPGGASHPEGGPMPEEPVGRALDPLLERNPLPEPGQAAKFAIPLTGATASQYLLPLRLGTTPQRSTP